MVLDGSTTVGALREAVAAFVNAREWRPFHSPKHLSMSIAIEAAELMEHFQWLTAEQAQASAEQPAEQAAIAEELADIIIYCLSLSNALDLDLSSAVLGKLQTNEHRYPADEFRGRFRRPERDKAGSLAGFDGASAAEAHDGECEDDPYESQ
jgi:NTP pyrophosphatase (non-canonical NTP hydrolase)